MCSSHHFLRPPTVLSTFSPLLNFQLALSICFCANLHVTMFPNSLDPVNYPRTFFFSFFLLFLFLFLPFFQNTNISEASMGVPQSLVSSLSLCLSLSLTHTYMHIHTHLTHTHTHTHHGHAHTTADKHLNLKPHARCRQDHTYCLTHKMFGML